MFEELIDWDPPLESVKLFRGSVLQVGLCLGDPLRPRPTRGTPGMALRGSREGLPDLLQGTCFLKPKLISCPKCD